METEEIKVGNYTFLIKDNTHYYDDRILYRNFSIGGADTVCVDVSITFKNNEPYSASIPYLLHNPDCSIDNNLEKGKGKIIMIKTLLEYIHNKIPSIKEFHFEDNSSIESASQEEIQKKGKHIIPIPLYYFSIAFNGITWYEKQFNARLKDPKKHKLYREKVEELLYSGELKQKTSFIEFLQISKPPSLEIINELKPYYETSDTFNDFFQSIPSKDRIRLVHDWIKNFMMYHLKDVFSNKDWIIEVGINENVINENVINEKKGGRKTKRQTKKYYCPNVRINLNPKYNGLNLRQEDLG